MHNFSTKYKVRGIRWYQLEAQTITLKAERVWPKLGKIWKEKFEKWSLNFLANLGIFPKILRNWTWNSRDFDIFWKSWNSEKELINIGSKMTDSTKKWTSTTHTGEIETKNCQIIWQKLKLYRLFEFEAPQKCARLVDLEKSRKINTRLSINICLRASASI